MSKNTFTHKTSHSDIVSDGWFDRYAPASWLPYLKLGRFDRPVGVWLTLFPGYWGLTLGAGGFKSAHLPLYLYFLIGAFFIRAAGCVVNDLWDRNLDKAVERTATRPLASGQLNLRQAFAFLFFLLSCAFAVLIQLPLPAILIGVFAVIPICIYPLMKRFTFWPQLFLGLTFNLSLPIGWFSTSTEWSLTPLLLYFAVTFWTIGYDTIYAFQDIKDDLKIGIKSTAIKFQSHPKLFVSMIYGIGFILSVIGFGALWYYALPLAAHATWQLRTWDINDRYNALVRFKSNASLLCIVWLGLVVGLAL